MFCLVGLFPELSDPTLVKVGSTGSSFILKWKTCVMVLGAAVNYE